MAKRYIDIGHANVKARLWIFNDGKLVTVSASGGNTHEKQWGFECIKWFRGRYDPETNELSLVYPENWPSYYGWPEGLKQALHTEFGAVTPTEFSLT